MYDRRLLGMVPTLVVLVLAVSARPADGQVSAEDGQQFIGHWTLTFEPPAGGFGGGGGRPGGGGPPGGGPGGGPPSTVLDITDTDGQLAAELTGGPGGGRPMTGISMSGANLVLSYEMSFQGTSVPATLTLTPDEDSMNVEQDFGGQFQRTGTAAKD